MPEKLFPGVYYEKQRQVKKDFCPHTVGTILPHALGIGGNTLCVQCLMIKLQEVMYISPDYITRWCATCQQFRQTKDGVCLTCGSQDLRD